jgi:hypothetical protein
MSRLEAAGRAELFAAFRAVGAKFADSILLIKSDGDQTEAVTLTKTCQVRSRTSRDGVRTSGSGGPAPADQTVLKIITRLPENAVKVWSRTMKKSNKNRKETPRRLIVFKDAQ